MRDRVMRDMKGYGRTPPHPEWPGGARVAVSFVINFEEGAEMSLSAGDASNEKVYEVTDEVAGVADLCMETHFAYGTKAAWWRIADKLERHSVPATVSACGRAAELSPWLIEDAVKRGHEIACHGWPWEKHPHLKEPQQRQPITNTARRGLIGPWAGRPAPPPPDAPSPTHRARRGRVWSPTRRQIAEHWRAHFP